MCKALKHSLKLFSAKGCYLPLPKPDSNPLLVSLWLAGCYKLK